MKIAKANTIYRSGSARLPTAFGDFTITVYGDDDGKEHLAVAMGDLNGPPSLVRMHSECMTGDIFGSVRCDCGEQLRAALQFIAQEGRGLLLYLRQEGRGIGLTNKIRAYALQDQGMDTVEANLHLGFPADGRSYTHAAAILQDQGIHSIRLATNNPEKMRALEACGIRVVERVHYDIQPRPENCAYLETKASKMGHFTNSFPGGAPVHQARPIATLMARDHGDILRRLRQRLQLPAERRESGRPLVTLSYAQSLDGSIAARRGKPLQLSNPQSQALTHQLRSLHDAVLVGINTVLSDDPRLTVRLVAGRNPQPVVLDGRLRLPLSSKLLCAPCVPPIVATGERASSARMERLRQAGARIVRLPFQRNGLLDIRVLMKRLGEMGIRSLMVEGGSRVITDFLKRGLVDQMIVTIVPQFVGGLNAVQPTPRMPSSAAARLVNVQYQSFAGDLVLYADVEKVPQGQRAQPHASEKATHVLESGM